MVYEKDSRRVLWLIEAALLIGSKPSTKRFAGSLAQAIREAKNLELNLMSGSGSQPTSLTFMKECRGLGTKRAFTAYANPKGNANTERLIRAVKEELCWLRQ